MNITKESFVETRPVLEELTMIVNGVSYLLVDCKVDSFTSQNDEAKQHSLFTLCPTSKREKVTKLHLQEFRDNCLDVDDIFQPEFLTRVVFYRAEGSDIDCDPSAKILLASWNTQGWDFVQSKDGEPRLQPGPYVEYRGKIWEPWRIYSDDYLTMTQTFKPEGTSGTGRLKELDNTLTANNLRVVVPPRSYSLFQRSTQAPLNGVRIAVKDIFDIDGFKTTLCNRAWTDYHSRKTETAPSIQRLQHLGGVIVGKTRLNAMVVREETMECVEFLAPFNPRGDGYQTSSGSSSGSCAALGAYPWIDFAIGSDTNGSCRKPAYWNGCFAIRPTHGVLDTSGVTSFCPKYDVPALFGRDLSLFKEFINLWYGGSEKLIGPENVPTSWTRILYPKDYLPTPNNAQMELIDSFVGDMENFLGIRRTLISLADMWCETCPVPVEEKDVSEYLRTAGTLPYYKDACGLLKSFVDGYNERFGKAPFFHRALRWRWKEAEKVTPEERKEGWERIDIYRKWLLEEVFTEGTIVILPIDEGKPNYRDAIPPSFGLLSGFSPLYMSPIAGSPEVSAPIGEITYQSSISQRCEPLPISVSVTTAPGTDLGLLDLVQKTLEHGKRPVKVGVGRFLYGQ